MTGIRIYFITILIIGGNLHFAQHIKFEIKNTNSTRAELFSVTGEKIILIDSIASSSPGNFSYEINAGKLKNGLYRLIYAPNKALDFIFDNRNVSIRFDSDKINASIDIIDSESNQIYQRFLKLNKEYKIKTELLQLILMRFPKDDEFYNISKTRLIDLQNEYVNFTEEVSQKEPNTFAARYIRSSRLPVINAGLNQDEWLNYLKRNALNYVDFNDDELVNSDCFTNKAIEYLTYFRNPQLPMELLEKEFLKAVDTLLIKSSANIFVYQHIADYLIDGFKKFGFNNAVDYIIENYVVKDDLCLDEQTENSVKNRINQSKLLAINSKAPNIVLPDISGNTFHLDTLHADNILILFYSALCPHCKDIMPGIGKLYKNKKDLKVIAVSLDESRERWSTFVEENKMDWINVSDLKGWNSQAAREFFVYATPTMFLLSKEKRIIGKPASLKDLLSSLK